MKMTLAAFAALATAVAAGQLSAPAFAQTTNGMVVPEQAGSGSFNGFGKTDNSIKGNKTTDVYTHTWYCDTSIGAKSMSGCEVGTIFKKPPNQNYDPIYITVPLGFSVPAMSMDCPDKLVCVDHPATIDLSAIGGPANAMTPGHDHFTTTVNNGRPEWWDVFVIGVKDAKTYQDIKNHRSFEYIQQLIKRGDKNVTAPIPTNLFLYFAVAP